MGVLKLYKQSVMSSHSCGGTHVQMFDSPGLLLGDVFVGAKTRSYYLRRSLIGDGAGCLRRRAGRHFALLPGYDPFLRLRTSTGRTGGCRGSGEVRRPLSSILYSVSGTAGSARTQARRHFPA